MTFQNKWTRICLFALIGIIYSVPTAIIIWSYPRIFPSDFYLIMIWFLISAATYYIMVLFFLNIAIVFKDKTNQYGNKLFKGFIFLFLAEFISVIFSRLLNSCGWYLAATIEPSAYIYALEIITIGFILISIIFLILSTFGWYYIYKAFSSSGGARLDKKSGVLLGKCILIVILYEVFSNYENPISLLFDPIYGLIKIADFSVGTISTIILMVFLFIVLKNIPSDDTFEREFKRGFRFYFFSIILNLVINIIIPIFEIWVGKYFIYDSIAYLVVFLIQLSSMVLMIVGFYFMTHSTKYWPTPAIILES